MSEPAPSPSPDIHFAVLFGAACVAAFAWLGKIEVAKIRSFERENPYTVLAMKINRLPNREWCDDHEAKQRVQASQIVDRFGADIKALWKDRGTGNEPKFSLLDLGAAKLRVSPKLPPASGFDSSAWSWDEAVGLIQRTQNDPHSPENVDRWRDVDSMVRFLVEKDYSRLVYGKKFDEPDVTEHQFRPNPTVLRSGEREFTVQLDPGDFRGHEETLRNVLEPEWRGNGYRVHIEWVVSGGEAYRLGAHHDSNRSFVNHRRRSMEIANLAWTKTVAHELGHVLGFDDHYYNVWNGRNCYYSQQSRLGDLMSNSEHGAVTPRHWQVLDHAYPWRKEPLRQPFTYVYGK